MKRRSFLKSLIGLAVSPFLAPARKPLAIGKPLILSEWRRWRRLSAIDDAILDKAIYRFAHYGPVVRYPGEGNLV